GGFDHLEERLLLGDAHPYAVAFEPGQIALGATFVLSGTDIARRLLGVELVIGLLKGGYGRFCLGLELVEVGAMFFDGEGHDEILRKASREAGKIAPPRRFHTSWSLKHPGTGDRPAFRDHRGTGSCPSRRYQIRPAAQAASSAESTWASMMSRPPSHKPTSKERRAGIWSTTSTRQY